MSRERESLCLPAKSFVGRYRLDHVHGSWGFYITYLAEADGTARRVLVHELVPEELVTRAADGRVQGKTDRAEESLAWARERFVLEGRGLSACTHPSVRKILEVFEANGTAYWVTPIDEARNLKRWLEQLGHPPTEAELRTLLRPLLDALEQLHGAGLHHLNLKLDTIQMTPEGQPVLVHFAGSRQAIARHSHAAGAVTTGYSPIEQYDGTKSEGPWTDIYGLAAVTHRLMTGQVPPEATERLGSDPYQKLATRYAGKYSAEFLSAIDAALATDPPARPQNIEGWRKMPGISAVATAAPWRGKPALLAGLAALVLALAGTGAWYVFRPKPVPPIIKKDVAKDQEKKKEEEAEAEKKKREEEKKVAEAKAAEERQKAEERRKADEEKERKLAEEAKKAEEEQKAAEKAAEEKAAAGKQAEDAAAQKEDAAKTAEQKAQSEAAAAEQVAKKVDEAKGAVRKKAAEKAAAEAEQKAADAQAAADKAAAESAAADVAARQAALDTARAEKIAADKAVAQKSIEEQAAATATDRAAAEAKLATDQASTDKAAADKAAAEKAEQSAAAEKAAAQKTASEKAAAEKAAADKLAAAVAAQKVLEAKVNPKKTEDDTAGKDKTAAERAAAEKAAAEKAAAEKAAADKAAAEKAEAEMAAKKAAEEKAAADKAAADKAAADKAAADKAAQSTMGTPPPGPPGGSAGQVGSGLGGVWETVDKDANGKPLKRLIIYPDTHYALITADGTNTGIVRAKLGIISMEPDNGRNALGSTFVYKSMSLIDTDGALGKFEWVRVSADAPQRVPPKGT